MLWACGQPQDRLCGGHAKTQAYALVRVGPYVAAHLPGCCSEPILLTNGDELFAVQVAVPGDAEVLADLLQFLLYPVRGGQRGTGRSVQVIRVPEAQLPWKRGKLLRFLPIRCTQASARRPGGFARCCSGQSLPPCSSDPKEPFALPHPAQSTTCNFGVWLPAPAWLSDSTRRSRSCSAFNSYVPPQASEPRIQAQGELQPGPRPGVSLGTWMSPMANVGWWPGEAQPCRLRRWHGWKRDPSSSGQLWNQGRGLSKLHIHIHLDQVKNFSGCLSP